MRGVDYNTSWQGRRWDEDQHAYISSPIHHNIEEAAIKLQSQRLWTDFGREELGVSPAWMCSSVFQAFLQYSLVAFATLKLQLHKRSSAHSSLRAL